MKETLVLVSGPRAWSSLLPRNASDGCISHHLGSSHEWPPCPRSVEWSPSHVAHQLPGDAGRASSTQTLSTRPERSPCVGASTDNTAVVFYINHLEVCVCAPCTSWFTRSFCGPKENSSLRAVHIPGHQLRPGEWIIHPEVVKQIWRVLGQAQVDLLATRQTISD